MSSPNDNAGRIHKQAFVVSTFMSFAWAQLMVTTGRYRGSVHILLVDHGSALLYSLASTTKALDRRWLLNFCYLLLDNSAEHNVFSHYRRNVSGGSINYETSGYRTSRKSSPGDDCVS